MFYIQPTPNEIGAYSSPQSLKINGLLNFPDEFIDEFVSYNGFVVLSVEGDTVTGIEPNIEAWEKWKATQTETEEVTELEQLRADIDYIAVMTGVEL